MFYGNALMIVTHACLSVASPPPGIRGATSSHRADGCPRGVRSYGTNNRSSVFDRQTREYGLYSKPSGHRRPHSGIRWRDSGLWLAGGWRATRQGLARGVASARVLPGGGSLRRKGRREKALAECARPRAQQLPPAVGSRNVLKCRASRSLLRPRRLWRSAPVLGRSDFRQQ